MLIVAFALVLCLASPAVAAPTAFVTGPSANTIPTPAGGMNHPVGVVVQGSRLLETDECNDTILAFDDQGNKSVFATLPTYPPRDPSDPTSVCREAYITGTPASRPEWQGRVFVIKGPKVYAITTGGQVSLFATLPCRDDQNGITFDTTGSWGYQLIVDCIDGHVYSLDANGNATLKATLPFGGEGPAVAPANFPNYGGQLLVPDELDNAVMAVSPTGAYTKVASFTTPEHINFVPPQPCPMGQSGGVYFTANPSNTTSTILKWPAQDFQGLAGEAIVTGEDGPVALLNQSGQISTFDTTWGGTFEGASFVDTTGCSSGSSSSSTAPHVYVGDNGSSSVFQFGVTGGGLSPLSPPSVSAGPQPIGVAASPDGSSLYVVNAGSATVSQYNVSAATGVLSPKNPASVTTDGTSYGAAVSPDGKSLYVANYGTNTISQFSVNGQTGALSPKSPPTVPAGGRPQALAVTPDGKSAYAVNSRDGTISQYNVDATSGVLTPKTPATVAAGDAPEAVAVSSDGNSVYVVNTGDNNVEQYSVGSTGGLTPKGPATVTTGSEPVAIAVSKHGSAYVVDLGSNQVSEYNIDSSTGGLSAKSPSSIQTGRSPMGIALSPDASSAYVTNQADNSVSQYSVDSTTGRLTGMSPATVPAGSSPWGIVALGTSGTGSSTSTSTPPPPASTNYPQVVSGTSGLVSYWRLGEEGGTTAADTASGRKGSYVNGPALGQPGAIAGDANTAVSFNGTNQYVNVPYSPALNTKVFSAEAWAKVTGGSGTYRTVLGSRSYPNGYCIYATASNTWEAWLGNGSTSMQVLSGGSISSGWHHLVVTADGSTARFYVDGVLKDSSAVSVSPNTGQNLTMGMNDGGNDFPFVGTIDEVALYNTALSAATVQQHYSAAQG